MVLNSTYVLWDVRDVEGFCADIAGRVQLDLSCHDREDLLAFLVVECWQLAERYRPGGITFSTYAGNTLPRRVIDWQRTRFGRTRWTFSGDRVYERLRPEFVSIDDERRGLDALLVAGGGVDGDEDRLADQLRVLRARGRPPARYEREVRSRAAG